MTANNITTKSMTNLAEFLSEASTEVAYYARLSLAGEISPEQAAKEINRIGVKLEKALYPEDN